MEWEYKIITIPVQYAKPDHKSVNEIAHLGDEGWELMTVTPLLDKGTTVALLHHMRKPKEQERRAGFAP